MVKMFFTGMSILLWFNGCSQESKVVHELECVLHSVINIKNSKEVVFNRQDAINNGYVYDFQVFSDGKLVVNEADYYVKDQSAKESYSLLQGQKVNQNMKYIFTHNYENVEFFLKGKGEKYTFDCGNVNEKLTVQR